jgi:hypothetical protein
MTIDGRKLRSSRPAGCAVCKNPLRQQIEIMRLGGASLDALAAQHGFSRDSLFRHMKNHLTARRKAELTGAGDVDKMVSVAAKESRSVLEYFSLIRSGLMELFLTAVSAGDRYGAAAVAGRLNENLRATASISGELRQAAGITINNNTLTLMTTPGFAELHAGLLNVIRNHPDARDDIVALLRSLDAPTAEPNSSSFRSEPVLIEGEAVDSELADVE